MTTQENASPEPLPELMTASQVASYLKITVNTLRKWGLSGKLIPIRLNKRGDRRYRRTDIEKLLEQ